MVSTSKDTQLGEADLPSDQITEPISPSLSADTEPTHQQLDSESEGEEGSDDGYQELGENGDGYTLLPGGAANGGVEQEPDLNDMDTVNALVEQALRDMEGDLRENPPRLLVDALEQLLTDAQEAARKNETTPTPTSQPQEDDSDSLPPPLEDAHEQQTSTQTQAETTNGEVAGMPTLPELKGGEMTVEALREEEESAIRDAMAGFTLPESARPEWAKAIPEEEWLATITARVKVAPPHKE